MPFRLAPKPIAALLVSAAFASSAYAIEITPDTDAMSLADELFLNQSSITLTGAEINFGIPFEDFFEDEDQLGPFPTANGAAQSGTYTNDDGIFGLPAPGVVFSTGDVADYATGPNTSDGNTSEFNTTATEVQNELLGAITGQSTHRDVVELDIFFDAGDDVDTISFVGAFGSEEYPEFVGSEFVDGFGIFINGTNVASALQTGAPAGSTPLPINIDHPDFSVVPGTELDGILAPNNVPLVRFDVPVTPNSSDNQLKLLLADASDSILDTTIFLSTFGDFTSVDGTSEFTPLLPSNPPDENGTFVIELDAPSPDETVWVDPPVTTGYEYELSAGAFTSVTAPSLLTVNDADGYTITAGGLVYDIMAGQTVTFATPISDFILSGISPDLMLDPLNNLAFPLGITFTSAASLSITPITVELGGGITPIPLPAGGVLLLGSLLGLGALRRRG